MTRAQEAEENYVIKRELAVVRQQCSVASDSLEKAQDTIRELQQQKVKTHAGSACCWGSPPGCVYARVRESACAVQSGSLSTEGGVGCN